MTTRETTFANQLAFNVLADQLTKPMTPSDFQARVIGLLAFEPDFETHFNYRVFPQGEFVNGERNDNVSEETGLPLHRVELEVRITDIIHTQGPNQADPFWHSVIGVFYCEDLTDVLGTLTSSEPDDVWGLVQGNNTYRSVLDIPTPIHPTRGSNDPQIIGGQTNVLPIYHLLSDAMLTYLDATEAFPAEWTRTFTTEIEGK